MRVLGPPLVVLAIGCGGRSASSQDASTVAFDASCRAHSRAYPGVLVDGVAASSMLVGAWLVVQGDPSRVATTDAHGQFVLCAPDSPFAIDVTTAVALSGQLVEASDEALPVSVPPFTATRIAAVLASVGQTFDPARGLVIAIQVGAVGLELDGAPGPALSNDGGAWIETATGNVVLFPDATPGSRTLTRPTDGMTLVVPAVANQITWVHVPHILL